MRQSSGCAPHHERGMSNLLACARWSAAVADPSSYRSFFSASYIPRCPLMHLISSASLLDKLGFRGLCNECTRNQVHKVERKDMDGARLEALVRVFLEPTVPV